MSELGKKIVCKDSFEAVITAKEKEGLCHISISSFGTFATVKLTDKQARMLHRRLGEILGDADGVIEVQYIPVPSNEEQTNRAKIEAVSQFMHEACKYLFVPQQALLRRVPRMDGGTSVRKTRPVTRARAILCYVISKTLPLSTPLTGKILNIDHSSVILCRNRVMKDIETLGPSIDHLTELLRNKYENLTVTERG